MDNKKKLIFSIDADNHARLRIKLQYERLTQSMFFNIVVKGYLEDDQNLKKFMNTVFETIDNKKTFKNRLKDTKEYNDTISDYALNKEEISNIFDIIQKESEDI